MRKKFFGVIAAFMLPLASLPAAALDILLTNDDGFETENIQALYNALVAEGHNVVMSAPYLGQSGSGGKASFLQPLLPTSEESEGGLLPAGSPAVGPTTLAAQQFYVDGSPVDSVLYGIDVAAPSIFGGRPDLVVSGPNEGNNLGLITPHSGTLGATVAAINKGIPAIAVSASRDDETPAEAALIAAVALKVVDSVIGSNGVKLEPGTGLNVNIPDVDPDSSTADDFDFKLTRVGLASNIGLLFFERIGESPIAQAFGVPPETPFPGLSVTIPYTAAGHPEDTSGKSEGNVIGGLTVTVSPIQGTYAADPEREEEVASALESLFDSDDDDDDD